MTKIIGTTFIGTSTYKGGKLISSSSRYEDIELPTETDEINKTIEDRRLGIRQLKTSLSFLTQFNDLNGLETTGYPSTDIQILLESLINQEINHLYDFESDTQTDTRNEG